MPNVLNKLFALLRKEQKRELFFIVALASFISVIEMLGISLIMPFVQMAVDFGVVQNNPYYHRIFEYFHFDSPASFVIAFGILLIFFYLFRSAVNLYYYYKTAQFSKKIYYDIALRLFKNFIGFSYRNFIERNSSHLVQSIITEANNVSSLVTALVLMFGEITVVTFIYLTLLYINWKITLLLTLFLAINALLMAKTVSKRIKKAGEERARKHRDFYELLNKTFGNFKMIKLRSNEKSTSDKFDVAGSELVRTMMLSETIAHVPRLFLEAIGFILIILMIIYWIVKYGGDVSSMMGVLSVFILALYRLLPSFNRIFSGYNQLMFLQKSVDIVHEDLSYEPEKIGNEKIGFEKEIVLENVSFAYQENKPVLSHVNLTIKKGEKVAFIGPSGSGKSTLVDIIIGLYKPSEGHILIDGKELTETNIRSWRQKIGYIPQNVYLFDATVAQNVAFSSEGEIDEQRVVEVLKQAKIYDFLEKNLQGIHTRVGEGGVKLSGGQKQRIAIARALYHNPELLVLDEATSALDKETEKTIMDTIYSISEKKTLIIIAHRHSTIELCNSVYKVENRQVVRIR